MQLPGRESILTAPREGRNHRERVRILLPFLFLFFLSYLLYVTLFFFLYFFPVGKIVAVGMQKHRQWVPRNNEALSGSRALSISRSLASSSFVHSFVAIAGGRGSSYVHRVSARGGGRGPSGACANYAHQHYWPRHPPLSLSEQNEWCRSVARNEWRRSVDEKKQGGKGGTEGRGQVPPSPSECVLLTHGQ